MAMKNDEKNKNYILEAVGGLAAGTVTGLAAHRYLTQDLEKVIKEKIPVAINEIRKEGFSIAEPETIQKAENIYNTIHAELIELDKKVQPNVEELYSIGRDRVIDNELGKVISEYTEGKNANITVAIGLAIGSAVVAGVAIWAAKKCLLLKSNLANI